MKPQLTDERRDQLSSEIYNISRRIRQITNHMPDDTNKVKLVEYITKLNEIGTEVLGGIDVMMSKVLRS